MVNQLRFIHSKTGFRRLEEELTGRPSSSNSGFCNFFCSSIHWMWVGSVGSNLKMCISQNKENLTLSYVNIVISYLENGRIIFCDASSNSVLLTLFPSTFERMSNSLRLLSSLFSCSSSSWNMLIESGHGKKNSFWSYCRHRAIIKKALLNPKFCNPDI